MNDMIKLSTPVHVPELDAKLTCSTVVTGIGSCFSVEMLNRLFQAGVPGSINPNGIVYNAVSIRDSLEKVAASSEYDSSDFFEFNGKWNSWLHHGYFSRANREEAVACVNAARREFREHLGKSGLVVVTPSSSVVYIHKATGKIVANCHKVPNNEFERRLLSVAENTEALNDSIASIRSLAPDAMIVVTLSPVRHHPGELKMNSQSKARTLIAIHECIEAHENILYFPSYEIALDELRDYRFFKEDMLHLTGTAIDIIYQRFTQAFFSPEALEQMKLEHKKQKRSRHIPLSRRGQKDMSFSMKTTP